MKKIIIALILLLPAISYGAFFGHEYTQPSDTAGCVLNYIDDDNSPRISNITADGSGTVDSLWSLIWTSANNLHIRMALYNQATRAFVCSTASINIATAGRAWISGAVLPANATITSGVDYVLAVVCPETNSVAQYRMTGSDSLWRIERPDAWPSSLTLIGLDNGYHFIQGVTYGGATTPPQPDSLNWVAFDSLHNDFAADSDSVVVMIYAPPQTADTIKLRVITGASYPSYSTGTLYQYDYPTAGDTIYDTLIVVLTESGTFRARAWAYYDSANPDTSIHVQDTIYFSAGSSGTVDVGEIVEAFKSEGFVTRADSEYFKALFSGSISLPDSILQKIIYSGTDTNWISKTDLDSIIDYRIDSVMTAKWAQYGNKWRIIR